MDVMIRFVDRKNQCHAPEGASIVENWCRTGVQAVVSTLECVRMMHNWAAC